MLEGKAKQVIGGAKKCELCHTGNSKKLSKAIALISSGNCYYWLMERLFALPGVEIISKPWQLKLC